ncbi:MAG: galactose-1-phosphate uridylyltransferase [Chthoniobacteraceae bacterium]
MDPFAPGVLPSLPPSLHEAGVQAIGTNSSQVRVLANRAPLLRIEGDPVPRAEGFYDRMDGVGAHEVVLEDAGDRALEDQALSEIEVVIEAWKLRMLDLMRDPRLRSFFVLKSVGREAGALVTHSLSQVIAMAVVPPALRNRLQVAREFYARKKRSIFADLLAEEVRVGTRLVYENNGFTVYCPYASRAPFQMAILPKRQCPDFHGLTDQERAQFADVLRAALRKLRAALDRPPYQLALITAPTRTRRADRWHTIEADFRWQVEIVPQLFPTFPMEWATGCAVNAIWPEVAASHLRNLDPSA